ncbi:hypothetical protein D3C75_1004380 [compost metagenome]
MRCGAALVSVYSGGNLQYARHGENCLLSYRYENRLAQDVVRLIVDPALRGRLAEQGEADSLAWTWNNSVTSFEQAVMRYMQNIPRNESTRTPLLRRMAGY